MAGVTLYDYQEDAVRRMRDGCILCGKVGSGKSRTALAYYYLQNGGKLSDNEYVPMDDPPLDLYVITTARKRDTLEWEGEFLPFLISSDSSTNLYANKVVVDSWNNIKKYEQVQSSFFIFDEQRVVGNGAWVKAFLKIAKRNRWILLSATPGDSWNDYVPVFLANGFFKNRAEFTREHVVYSHFAKFPKVDHYVGTGELVKMRRSILVEMDYSASAATVDHREHVRYDKQTYKDVGKTRWDPYKDEPIENAAGLCYVWRKVVNSDISRMEKLEAILKLCQKAIVFYNFDYELELLRNGCYQADTKVAEWNGHKHEPVPTGKRWVYLVQYTAGCEGWNCTKTDTTIFFSLNYSYKVMEQAKGRINRLNTPFKELHYYYLESRAPIDMAIRKALDDKHDFNEGKFAKW